VDEVEVIEEGGDFVIKFRCRNCNQKIRVPKIHADKKGRCPKCKNIVVVPKIEKPSPVTSQSKTGDLKISSNTSNLDLTLLDVPQKNKAPNQPTSQDSVSDKTLEELEKLKEGLAAEQTESVGERKQPWLIDIFLYPASKAGLTMLGIIIGIPLAIHILVKLAGIFTLVFPPFLVFFALLAIVRFIIAVIFALYMYWYICECIRDSAMGGLRAPETLGNTPGLGEMLWQLIKILGCLAFFSLPALIYFLHTRRIDTIFWLLSGCAAFFFPMGLLAVIMFDSLSGLNPVLLIGSIFSTFFQYCGLVIFLYALTLLTALMVYILPQLWISGHIIKLASLYQAMVAAHLLGRFGWRYQEKLYWEV